MGVSESVQREAVSLKGSVSSTPASGCTENKPGCGGLLVIIAIDASAVIPDASREQYRVKVRAAPGGKVFGAMTRFVAAATSTKLVDEKAIPFFWSNAAI